MLIQLLKSDSTIASYLDTSCVENGISVNIDPNINMDDIIIIKVDRYYNQQVHKPGPSPDCLVVLRCSESTYRIFIVELKDIDGPQGFTIENVKDKFISCLGDFMSNRFAHYFHNTLFNYEEIKLLFITDPYDFKNNPRKQERMRGHKLDALIAQRIPRYFNKHLYLEHKVPNPTIKGC